MKKIYSQKNIVYAADEKFAEILAVSMESLLMNNTGVTVYVLNNGISHESMDRLRRRISEYSSEIHFVPLKDLEEYAGCKLSCQGKITRTAYFRLFMAEILPEEVEILLYLDCDTLVLKPLDDLFCHSILGFCGAVAEPTAKRMKSKIGLRDEDPYFNSGVLLVDLRKWRSERITDHFIAYIEEMKGTISFEDQGVLNHVLRDRIDPLPFKYNVTTQFFDFGYRGFSMMKQDEVRYERDEVDAALQDPSIIHFTNSFASVRPWVEGSEHIYASIWKKIQENTEWENIQPWKAKKDLARRISKVIYEILPGDAKYKFIYFLNGIVRPKLS